jgi:hypothetical protein
MKDLIRKILKENQDDFGWVEADDNTIEQGRSLVYQNWKNIEEEFNVNLEGIFGFFTENGISDVEKLSDIASELYDQFESAYDYGKDIGYEHGIDNCDCEGCCDDYVWYETYDEDVRAAKEEGYDDGYNRGLDDGEEKCREELSTEIEELKSRIEELENQLNENIN